MCKDLDQIIQELHKSYSMLRKEVKILKKSTLKLAEELDHKNEILQELYQFLLENHDTKQRNRA